MSGARRERARTPQVESRVVAFGHAHHGHKPCGANCPTRNSAGDDRLLVALEMSLFARELAMERIRREHPAWPETQVTRELIRLAFLPKPMPARLARRLASR